MKNRRTIYVTREVTSERLQYQLGKTVNPAGEFKLNQSLRQMLNKTMLVVTCKFICPGHIEELDIVEGEYDCNLLKNKKKCNIILKVV